MSMKLNNHNSIPAGEDTSRGVRTEEPRCQDPKKEYKIKPRIKERIQKEINLKGPCKMRAFEIFYLEFLWFLASWFLGSLFPGILVLDCRFFYNRERLSSITLIFSSASAFFFLSISITSGFAF